MCCKFYFILSYTLDCGIFLTQTPDLQAAGHLCYAHLMEVYQTIQKEKSKCYKLLIINLKYEISCQIE